jgi:hypothetical protein
MGVSTGKQRERTKWRACYVERTNKEWNHATMKLMTAKQVIHLSPARVSDNSFLRGAKKSYGPLKAHSNSVIFDFGPCGFEALFIQ